MLDSPFNVIIVRHWYLHIEKAYPESQKAKKKVSQFVKYSIHGFILLHKTKRRRKKTHVNEYKSKQQN